MPEKINPDETTINTWAKKLREIDPKEAAEIDEPKDVGLEGVEKLGLPRWESISCSLSDFVESPGTYLSKVDSELFYVNLKPLKRGDERFRQVSLKREEIRRFIDSNVSSEKYKDYSITILGTREILFGGSIIINEDGRMLLEARRGYQGPISDGTEVPEFSVQNDPYTGTFKYSFDDPKLRKMFYSTIISIPHEGESRAMKFPPGYYEFSIAKSKDGKRLEPKFFDYKSNKAYYLKYENPMPE